MIEAMLVDRIASFPFSQLLAAMPCHAMPSIHPSIHPSTHPPIYSSIHPSINQSIPTYPTDLRELKQNYIQID